MIFLAFTEETTRWLLEQTPTIVVLALVVVALGFGLWKVIQVVLKNQKAQMADLSEERRQFMNQLQEERETSIMRLEKHVDDLRKHVASVDADREKLIVRIDILNLAKDEAIKAAEECKVDRDNLRLKQNQLETKLAILTQRLETNERG